MYEKATALEPDDRALQDMRHKAEVAEKKQESAGMHKFRARTGGAAGNTPRHREKQRPPAAVKRKAALSFDDDDV